MAFDLIPNSFWNFPTLRSLQVEGDDEWFTPGSPSGISISEDEKSVYVSAALPGVNEEDIDITFDKGMLWLKGEAKEEEKERKFYRRATSSFSYRIAVPGELDLQVEPEAEYRNGVMTVRFAKSQQAQPKKITVKRNGNK